MKGVPALVAIVFTGLLAAAMLGCETQTAAPGGGEATQAPAEAAETPAQSPTLTFTAMPTAVLAATPPPAPTAAPTPAPTAIPAPTEEAPKRVPGLGTLAPLNMEDPDDFISELSDAERACLPQNSDPQQLMALLSTPELASSEETAELIQCLGDETLLRLFLAGLIGQTGPLTEETSKCVRSGFADFDVRAVRPAGVVESAMVGDIAAFLLTLSCLNEEEWQAVGPSLEMGPEDRESLQCLINELGGSEGIAAALQPDDGGPPTDYIRAKIACGLQSPGDDSSASGVGDDLDLVWVGNVNDVEFTASDLVQRIRVLQSVNRFHGLHVDLSAVPFESLLYMINAEILRQAAPELGIQPTEEAIDAELRRQFQPTAAAGQETEPGQLKREFQNTYQAFLTATGLTDSEYRVIVEEELTEYGLLLMLSQEIESPQEQVEVRWIRLPIDPNEAGSNGLQPDQVAHRLQVEDFEDVAQEVGRSDGYADPSGYVGWVPLGAFPDLDPLLYGAAALPPGEVSHPYYVQDGIFFIEVLSAPESRELDDRMSLKLATELTEAWKDKALQAGAGNGTVKINFNSSVYDRVAD